MVPPELSGVLELFTPQVADSGRHKRLQFLEAEAPLPPAARDSPLGPPAHPPNITSLLPATAAFRLPGASRSRLESLFRAEASQEELTRQVISRLQLDPTLPAYLLELGCASGAAALQVARQHPRFTIDGIARQPSVAEQAMAQAVHFGMSRRLRFWADESTATRAEAASYDGLYAIESASRDAGLAKEGFVCEAARLLKGGRRLVVADLFYQGAPPMGGMLGKMASRLHQERQIDTFAEIGAFTSTLRRHGFADIKVENVSAGFLQSTLKEPLLTLFRGLARARFAHCIVSARRRRL